MPSITPLPSPSAIAPVSPLAEQAGASAFAAPVASAAGRSAAAAATQPSAQGTPQPEQQQAPSPHRSEALQKTLDDILAQLQRQTSLRFRVEKDLGEVVVSVVDQDGNVLMQIPDEVALALARRLADTGTGLVDQQA